MSKERKDIAKFIKRTRENMEFSQKQFAILMNTSQARISYVENNGRGCSAELLLKVLRLNPSFKVMNIL